MIKHLLPEKINPFRFTENAVNIQGIVPIKNLSRLCASLYNNAGEVNVEIQCGMDEQGIRSLRGHLETQVILQCQRCMESFNYGIIANFLSGVVATEEEAELLPKQYDPIVVDKENLNLQDMIEDELIVNLPLIPMHDPKECKVKMPIIMADKEAASEGEKRNPFKVIESLRSNKTQQ